jgi:hypothetical protein
MPSSQLYVHSMTQLTFLTAQYFLSGNNKAGIQLLLEKYVSKKL